MEQTYTEWQVIDGSGYFVCGGIHFNDLIARSEASEMYSKVFKPGYQLYYTEKTTVSTPAKFADSLHQHQTPKPMRLRRLFYFIKKGVYLTIYI